VTGRILQTLVALVLSTLWAIALGFGYWSDDIQFLDRAEGALTDLRMTARGERPAPDLVTIVTIDDDTVAKKGGYPLPRAELAAIVDGIARLEPRVIAVDLLLLDRGDDGGNAALAQAFDKRPTAIAAAAVFPEEKQSIATEENGPLARLPRAEPAPAEDDPAAALRRRLIVSAVLSLPVLLMGMIPALQFRNWQWLCFALATLIAAFAPFYNPALYRD